MESTSARLRTFRSFLDVNCGFELVILNLDQLGELGLHRKFLRRLAVGVEEIRSEINHEIARMIGDREAREHLRYIEKRERREKKSEKAKK